MKWNYYIRVFVQKPLQNTRALPLRDVLVDCRLGSSSAICFLIDSGADVNIIGGSDWEILRREYHRKTAQLDPINVHAGKELRAFGSDQPLEVKCAFHASVEVVGIAKPIVNAEFLVVANGRRSLLGRSTASELTLLEVGLSVNRCESEKACEVFPKIPGVRLNVTLITASRQHLGRQQSVV